ncbi:mitochondrial carrier protein [Niveomyces insectorum RCEF 264]|uniref:Mitochondrial carrier protein n=1 Tax=Niveomyces insectorum RCEF 264 TaxID=1081102 RepID=A0A167MGY1_9HYPO|nr:mitochondrial carrier protein [Niveomyces insectorum RCEF 264]
MASTTPAASSHDHGGHGHDRFHGRQQNEGVETLPFTPPSIDEAVIADNDPPEITVVQRMLSATTGSLLTGLLVTPLDVVRVRLQSQRVSRPVIDFERLPANFRKIVASSPAAFRPSDLGVTACCREVFFMNANTEVCVAGPKAAEAAAAAAFPDCAVEQHQQKTFNSTVDALRKISRNEGLFTLWRGLSPTLVMSVPANIIYFTGYEWLRYHPSSFINRMTSDQYAPLAAGSAARVLAAAAVSPIELFRTRLQASQGESAAGHLKDTFHGLRTMVQQHGYRALWRGLTLTLWRDVPFSGMYWWGYETVRGQLTEARARRRGRDQLLDLDDSGNRRARARRRSQSRENHTATFVDSFAAGALSGAVASVATMPFDVGKTRTQVFRDAAPAPAATRAAATTAPTTTAVPEQQSMTRLLWHIFRTEGAAGLFKGWIPRTLKVAPACAIMISSYEMGKKVFRGINERGLKSHASVA